MSTVKRTAIRLAAVVAATVTTTAVAAGPSFAGIHATNALSKTPFGYGYFYADDNSLSIHDSRADGYGVAVKYYRYDRSNTGPYYAWNREGNGTTTYLYLNLPPLAEIKIYACGEKGGMILGSDCGPAAFGYSGAEI
jgi:hypothetical protein